VVMNRGNMLQRLLHIVTKGFCACVANATKGAGTRNVARHPPICDSSVCNGDACTVMEIGYG
jgi:hypothetical protein